MPVDSSLLSAILGSAGAGTALIVIMILTGVLNTGRYVDRVEKDAEYWKAAFTAERELSGAKEKAVTAAIERADAAVEVAKLTKELLEDLRRRTDAASSKAT
jgi:hypothetical protein